MNILVTGGTGFVGSHLTELFEQNGHQIYIMTRSPENHKETEQVKYVSTNVTAADLPHIHAAVNLAGASIFGYWTEDKKKAIIDSRMETTNNLITLFNEMEEKPEVLINASAVGYYGTSDEIIFTEQTKQPGDDFLAKVATKWESAAKQANKIGIRTIFARFGIILGQDGALPLMEKPVKLFLGGKIGNGEQWISWVHIDDLTHMINYCINHKDIEGPVNVTAPYPKRNKDFMKTIAHVWNRPNWTIAPAPLVKLIAGEMSDMVIKGQCVKPEKSLSHGYSFRYPVLEEALRDIKRKELQKSGTAL